MDTERHNQISGIILECAYKIHTDLGAGLFERIYGSILARKLRDRGLHVEVQKPIPVEYDGVKYGFGFRADLIVEGAVIVEIKSVEKLNRAHWKQLLTYLRFSRLKLGLLINFGEGSLKDGVRRIVNGLIDRPI